jgi:hypothetical protein
VLTYEDTHWGDEPLVDFDVVVLGGKARPLGELRAISYVAQKGGEGAVYRHKFETHADNRAPYLLTSSSTGEITLGSDIPPLVAVGPVIDFELTDGRRIIASNLYVCHSGSGRHVYLASPDRCPVAVERRSRGPGVTAHGIER